MISQIVLIYIISLCIDVNLCLDLFQEVDKFRELYITEQEEKLELDSELKCCKVQTMVLNFGILRFAIHFLVVVSLMLITYSFS